MHALPIQPVASLAFPWPRAGEVQRPAIKYVVRDMVWLAAVQQMVAAWRASRRQPMPLLEYHQIEEFPDLADGVASLLLLEVARDELPRVADWLATRRRRKLVVALLCRTSLAAPGDRAAAANLLGEAGAALTLAGPREAAQLFAVVDRYRQLNTQRPSDPLGELPLCCWDPAWQWPT